MLMAYLHQNLLMTIIHFFNKYVHTYKTDAWKPFTQIGVMLTKVKV